jgi:hypothetical protein
MFDVRAFIGRAPRPKRVRYRMPDGEERILEVRKGGKRLWDEMVSTIKTSGAVTLECLSEDGTLIRGKSLDEEDSESFEAAGDATKDLSKAMREQAAMLDAYGRRMNEAFQRGAEAASSSQDKLVELVQVLTQHLTIAITNLHNISTNYAQVLAQASEGGEQGQGTQALMGLVAAMTGKLPMTTPSTESNGKRKP